MQVQLVKTASSGAIGGLQRASLLIDAVGTQFTVASSIHCLPLDSFHTIYSRNHDPVNSLHLSHLSPH